MTTPPGTNPSSEDISPEDALKLRGDAIGDTMYTQSSVLRVLLQLQNVPPYWTQEEDNDFIFLWDITLEPDVCDYLLEVNYPEVAAEAITKFSHNSRLVEILIGIMSNVYSNTTREAFMDTFTMNSFFAHIYSSDVAIISQVMHLFRAIIRQNIDILETFLDFDFLSQLTHILENCLCANLLVETLLEVSYLTNSSIACRLVHQAGCELVLFRSSITAYDTIHIHETGDHDCVTDNQKNAFYYLLDIARNLCSCINFRDENDPLVVSLRSCAQDFGRVLSQAFSLFASNLEDCSWEEYSYYLNSTVVQLPLLKVPYNETLVVSLLKIVDHYLENDIDAKVLLDGVLYFFKLPRDNERKLAHLKECNVVDILSKIAASQLLKSDDGLIIERVRGQMDA